ncbi:MAG: IS4 family transposase [Actinobacteria bacterium]|nr:IS4 family transposase [Actinomycetota bacterium]
MAGSIAGAVARLKRGADPLGALGRGAVEAVCAELGYAWRDRELDPATTVALFVQQVLHGNCPCAEVRHLAAGRRSFTPGAYCQARSRLPLSVYRSLLTRVVDAALPRTREAGHRWRGHRVFHVDGTTFSMPDTPQLQEAFGQPAGQAKGCGFPAAHLLLLFSASTGLLLDAAAGPLYTGDVGVAAGMHPHLDAGDVLVGDDAFGTYAHLALLLRAGLHGLFPVHHSRIVDLTPGRRHCPEGKGAVEGMPRSRWVRSLGRDDQLVEWCKPKTRPLWMTQRAYADLPESITVRELRRTVTGPAGNAVTLTMVTTLTDPRDYPADGDRSLSELRMRRWDVETNIRHLKSTMRLDVLRCKTEQGVRKELCVFAIVYNLVRVAMLEAARRQDVPVARVSFADAYRWLRHARPGDVMPPLLINPRRPGRAEPRVVKRRAKPHDLMNKPRDRLRKALKKQGEIA